MYVHGEKYTKRQEELNKELFCTLRRMSFHSSERKKIYWAYLPYFSILTTVFFLMLIFRIEIIIKKIHFFFK